MAETFCPECGTVFDSAGTVCPNCAAIVGDMRQAAPRAKADSALSVMPLAKDSGGRRGFAEIDGSQLDLRTRETVNELGVDGPASPGPSMPGSGLAVEGRPERQAADLPELPQQRPGAQAAAAEAEDDDDGGWAKAALIVVVIVALAIGGKFVLDFVKKSPAKGDDQQIEEPLQLNE